jgi:LPS export ABC transporter permease LptG
MVDYYFSFLPVILVQTSSIACLIATLFTFSALNNSNEIIVMRASGLSFWQITRPAIFFGLIVSVLIFWLNETQVPDAMNRSEKIRNENIVLKVDPKRKKEVIRNLTFYGQNNRLYFIDSFDPITSELTGVTIIEYNDKQEITQKIVAWKGNWAEIAWKFYQCQVTGYGNEGFNQPVKIKVYKEKLMDIKETPEEFLKQRLNVNAMNIRQLRDYLQRFSSSGAERAINNIMVDIHQKIAYPFGNLVIVLVGLPFAMIVKGRKRSTVAALGFAVLIGFLYYVSNAVSLAFGKGGFLSPMLSAWITPMIFSFAAVLMIEKIS